MSMISFWCLWVPIALHLLIGAGISAYAILSDEVLFETAIRGAKLLVIVVAMLVIWPLAVIHTLLTYRDTEVKP